MQQHFIIKNLICTVIFHSGIRTKKYYGKTPFLKFGDIRKEFAKEVFREELNKTIYVNKEQYEKNLKSSTKNDLQSLKNKVKENLKLKSDDFNLKIVDITEEQKFIQEKLDKINVGEKLYIYDKNNPNNFTEISKEYLTKKVKDKNTGKWEEVDDTKSGEKLFFKNHGDNSIFYQENTFDDTCLFLKNLDDIEVTTSKKDFEKLLNEYNEHDEYLENVLR